MSFREPGRVALLVAGALALAACGGSAPPPTSPTAAAEPTALPTSQPATPVQPTPAAEPTAAPGTFTPGSVRYRVANLTDDPVDVYVRTDGLVEAFPVRLGLARGEVTGHVVPPDPGALLVTTAGSGDPTCVGSCPHFIGNWGNTNAHGDQNTVYVYQEGAVELWENPDPADVGTFANALPPAGPDQALVFPIARAVSGADSGLRVGFAGTDGCQQDVTESNLRVGGTTVLPFAFDGSADVLVYDSSDTECAGDPLGGPFTISGEPGSRTLLLLHGSTEEMEGLVLPIP